MTRGGSRWYAGEQSFDRRLSDEMGTAVRIERAPRCRVIDICQDGAEPGAKWLKFLAQERDTSLAVYADVSHP